MYLGQFRLLRVDLFPLEFDQLYQIPVLTVMHHHLVQIHLVNFIEHQIRHKWSLQVKMKITLARAIKNFNL
jgi:hypothetical protein